MLKMTLSLKWGSNYSSAALMLWDILTSCISVRSLLLSVSSLLSRLSQSQSGSSLMCTAVQRQDDTQNIRKNANRAKRSVLRCSQLCWSIRIFRKIWLFSASLCFCRSSEAALCLNGPLLCSLCNSPLTLQFILTYIFIEMYNTSLHYGAYEYPRWGKAIGVCIGATCCLQIIIWAIVAISKETGTLKEVSLGAWGLGVVIIQSDLLQFLDEDLVNVFLRF